MLPFKRNPLTGCAIMDPASGQPLLDATPVRVLMEVYASDLEPPQHELERALRGRVPARHLAGGPPRLKALGELGMRAEGCEYPRVP